MYNPDIETMPLKQLRIYQNHQLRKLLARLVKTPFYEKVWARQSVDLSKVNGVDDLWRLPFTFKSDLRSNYPFGHFACPMDHIRRIHASSGTTGKPTVVGYTQSDLKIFDEVVARSLVCAGAKPGMKLHNAYGYGLFTGGLGLHGGATKLGMAVIPVSGGMTERQITILKDFNPEVICCTPSYALTLAETCKSLGISPQALKVKLAVLGAEPWTELIRDRVENGLGVEATNIYGLSEVIGPGVSQEDVQEKGSGSYIWEDHFFPEVVDPETREPLPYGKEGVLVFTTLTKEAFPLIRYWTNDICSIYYDKGAKRTHIKMSPVRGRTDDMLIIRGVNLYHTQVEPVLSQFQEISANYQLLVQRAGTLDTVLVKVELDPEMGESVDQQSLEKQISTKLKDNIGLTMKVRIRPHGTIPRSQGGKLNRVIDDRQGRKD